MYRRIFLLFLLLALTQLLPAQDPQEVEDIGGYLMQYMVEDGDTTYIQELPPAVKRSWTSRAEKKNWRKFYRTVHNFAKTYPYALIAKEKVEEADRYIEAHHLKGSKKEKYLRQFQKDLFNTFEKPLRKLTMSQGRMLMRMIDREVGIVSYSIIKNYRGGMAAGFWQGIAKIFGADLKKPYDPAVGEDRNIEQLVEIYQKGDFGYLYFTIFGTRIPEPAQRAACDFPQKF